MTENTHNNVLDYQDPGELSEELLSVPGFVNELKNHTLAVAARPNPALAFAGALAMLAHLGGASYMNERGLRTNLYLAALAPTGMGKDEPRCTNKALATAAGVLDSVPDAIASGEALEDAVAASPSLLLQTDEADSLLTAMRGGDSRAARLNEMVLRFFSEAKSAHAMRLKANDGKARIIPSPHLTLFATGIPRFVYSAITPKALENGLLGRCLFIETSAYRPLGEPVNAELPQSCVETARTMARIEADFRATGVLTPVVVREDEPARAMLRQLKAKVDETARKCYEQDLAAASALYCRLCEKTEKLAMLYAISECPADPLIGAEAVHWGAKLATHITNRMLYEAQFHVAEGSFDRLMRRAINILARHNGKLDYSSLLKGMHIDANTFKRVIATLMMQDTIEDETFSNGKRGFILKTIA